MIKRMIALVVTSSVISAGLLYVGITLMGQFSPAQATSLNALVAGTNAWNSPDALPAGDSIPLTVDLGVGEDNLGDSSTPQTVPAFPVSSDQPLNKSVISTSPEPPVTEVTIAQLIKNPDQFIDQVVTITGIATSLDDDKFLLNDGTGQILVEVEDDLVSIAALNGLSIIVSGMLDDSSGQTGFELDASTLTYQDGTVVIVDDDLDDDNDNDGNNDDIEDDDDDNDNDDDNDDLDDDDNDNDDDDDNNGDSDDDNDDDD
jgi:uncharacterized protein YdeI (BOF family)